MNWKKLLLLLSWKRLFRISVIYSSKEDFASETIWACSFLFWKVTNYEFYFFNGYKIVHFISSWMVFGRLSRIVTFHHFVEFMSIELFIVFSNYSFQVFKVCHDCLLSFLILGIYIFFFLLVWLEIYFGLIFLYSSITNFIGFCTNLSLSFLLLALGLAVFIFQFRMIRLLIWESPCLLI